MNTYSRGFTLVEMMIALAVLGVICGIAFPTYTDVAAASHSTEARAALLRTLGRASNRAAVAAAHVVVCSSNDGYTCSGDTDWSQGWISFIDLDGDREHHSGEFLIDLQSALDSRVRLASTKGRTRLLFQPNGGNAGSNVTFTLCDRRGPASGQSIVMSNGGNLRNAKPDPTKLAQICPAA